MKYLTTYLDDEINFKFGNNGSIIELKAVDDHAVMSFSNEEKLLIRIKNEESYIKTVPVTAERKIIQLPTKLLKDLTVGQYDVELWQGEGDDQVIYPDEGFLRLKIHGNASQIDGSLVSSITLADFEKKFNELAKKIEDKLKNLPDVDSKINVDVKVEDGHLIINGEDTGVDLNVHDGKDGRDGHTPVITISDKGSLIIDGVDTNKSLIGPRGADGVPGSDGKSSYQIALDNGFKGSEEDWLKSLRGRDGSAGIDGRDGKSAYQVAVDNGFDGTEVEWLRSLHGNDGLDGKSGRDGLSAYELAKKDGFRGTEIEWLASLKGKDANPTLVLNTIHDKGFWGDTTIRNSFDPQINIVTTKPLKVGNLTSITIDNVVLPGKAAIGVGTLEGNTYTFAYCKVADLAVGDTTIQLDWPIQNNNYYLFVSGKPFQTRGNGDANAGSRFKYMLADTRNYDTGNRIKVDGESLGSFKYNFVLNYTGKTRIDLEQILKNTMPYANKKITFLGDSVTSGGTTSNGKQAFSYVDYLKDYLGAEITNKGLSGSVITEGNVENQTQSFVSRSNQIQDQDFVTIFGGINDFWFNSPLGSMEDSSDNVQSFYGALKFLVENLSKKNPIAHFLFVTPLKECKEGAPHTYEDNNKLVLHKNRAGFTEKDYVNAIKEVAAYYSVPVLDLFNSSNMNPYIESQRQYFADDLHPNQLGAQRLALIISQAINNGISSGFTRSVNGKNGLSPYQIAQKNGFEGSEIEWLESLKGKDGRDGSDAHVDLSGFLTKETANSDYAKKNEVPLIVYDAEKKVLTINGQNVEIPSSVDLSNYITKTDADKYALKSDVKNIVLDKDKRTLTVGKESIDIPNNIDLSPYYTKEEIDKKLTDIATNGKVDLTGYLRQSDLTDYAKKSDIPSQPDLTPYAKKTEIPQVSIDMEKRTITLNGNTIDIPSSVDLTDYAKKSDIPSIVLDGETNTLTINGTKIVIPGNVDLTPYYTKGEIDEKLADIQSGGKIDLSNYVNKQELDGYAKKSEIPSAPDLTPYETKENAEKTYATKQALADIQLTPGKDGENGKSAYDIAKEHGYTDTEENWLKSLHGRDGIDGKSGQNGVNGLSAYEVAQKNGFSGTEQEWLASLRGERGSAGLRGPKGDPGQIPDVSNINKGISDNKSDISKINLKMSTMFVNLLDFGAQPENVNFDNAPAFNKAIQALPSVGGTIFIPNGNYFLKSTVNIDRSYVHVMGLNHGLRSGIDPVDGSTQAGGGGAKVTVQNPITAFKLENTHNSNRLSGITFSGFDLRGDTNAGVGIDGVSNTDRVVIDNMTINNVGIGVRLHAADAPRITNSWIAETQSSILLTGASQQAEIKNNSLGAQPKGTTIYMENPDRFNISGNNIYPDGASAIRILNPVHGSIVGNTISAYYNGMIEFLPNSDGAFGNGNVISGNVIALESWHDNPDGKDNKWGIVHIRAFNNVIAGNNILANGTPTNTTGILVMKGDYNRISSNVITIQDTNSKVVINGTANNNWVIYSTEGSAFQDGGNQSNKNIGI